MKVNCRVYNCTYNFEGECVLASITVNSFDERGGHPICVDYEEFEEDEE